MNIGGERTPAAARHGIATRDSFPRIGPDAQSEPSDAHSRADPARLEAEVVMPADTSLLRRNTQDKRGGDGQSLVPVVRRGAPAAAKGEEGPPREPALVPAGLLDYAAFVLEQEARYCQQ
jgi:hypothetical protein